jgi:hypothetical protein
MAVWDATKPVANETPAVSANIRNNWQALQQGIGAVNLLADPTFLVWAAGDALAPTYWALSGVGAAILRCGAGLADTNRKHGRWSARVTAGGGAFAYLTQSILAAASYDDGFDGLQVSAGAWIRAAAAGAARLRITDGVGTTFSAQHTGGSTWQWLTLTHTVDVSANRLEFALEVATGQVAHISAPSPVIGAVPPSYPQAPRVALIDFHFPRVAGLLTVGVDKERRYPTRPGIVLETMLSLKAAAATQPVIVDVNTWDGVAFTSMYATRPQVAAGAVRGNAAPDSTYARRCFTGHLSGGATPVAGGAISIDIDQVGIAPAGSDLDVRVLALTFDRPLEGFLAYNEFGV